MEPNWIGLTAACSAFLGIWIGHVAVRKIEYRSPSIWVPSLSSFLLGALFEAGALFSSSLHVSTAVGIFGMTLLWDALEFWRQHRRVEKGHTPANPNNPRHAQILAESGSAMTTDLLNRDPIGRPVSLREAIRLVTERQISGS
ncbi:MAG: DUF4491 family protein [Anaerolineales bacterium]|jgi:hypothetical protein